MNPGGCPSGSPSGGIRGWPTDDAAFASPVSVQDVSADDPERSVMVYSSRTHGVTVIWVFGSSENLDANGNEANGDEP